MAFMALSFVIFLRRWPALSLATGIRSVACALLLASPARRTGYIRRNTPAAVSFLKCFFASYRVVLGYAQGWGWLIYQSEGFTQVVLILGTQQKYDTYVYPLSRHVCFREGPQGLKGHGLHCSP
jgi:hypothetical protein